MILELILLFVTLYLVYDWLRPKPPKGFPPGPKNYPLVGAALTLKSDLESKGGKVGDTSSEALWEMGKVYGPISGLYLMNTPTIVVNGYDLIKEISHAEAFQYRPPNFIQDMNYGRGVTRGVFNTNGDLWKENRRFTLRNLRDFGFGKRSLEGIVHEEVEEAFKTINKELKGSKDQVVFVHDKFNTSMINILWATVAGTRFSHDDQKLKDLTAIIYECFRIIGFTGNAALYASYPWTQHVPIVNSSLKTFMKGFKDMEKLIKETLEDRRATRDPSVNRDFFDIYLAEIEAMGEKHPHFFDDQLVGIVNELFAAGAEGTSNTVVFNLLYMLLNPDKQEKLHQELDKVVGKNRLPSMDDKPELHYLEAVLTETYRMRPIAPIIVPKTCVKDVEFKGYTIPKGSNIFMILQSVHMDKQYWGDPETFRPERFLDPEGKFEKKKAERVIPFGFGKRACIGESLARMSTFLLFAGIMQQYRLELPKGMDKPTTVPLDGVTVAPKPFKAKWVGRMES